MRQPERATTRLFRTNCLRKRLIFENPKIFLLAAKLPELCCYVTEERSPHPSLPILKGRVSLKGLDTRSAIGIDRVPIQNDTVRKYTAGNYRFHALFPGVDDLAFLAGFQPFIGYAVDVETGINGKSNELRDCHTLVRIPTRANSLHLEDPEPLQVCPRSLNLQCLPTFEISNHPIVDWLGDCSNHHANKYQLG